MAILLTGAAGFIGFHTAKKLITLGYTVFGVDNLNDYYDVSLKQARIKELSQLENFKFYDLDILELQALKALCSDHNIKRIIHLAAQPGVRYSIENPFAYTRNNIEGHLSILELCRSLMPNLDRLIYASSSSVYGSNEKVPYSEEDPVCNPVSLYAATKRADELISESYHSLYKIPCIGLRFFTVYGPYGRPDMAPFIFTKAILEGKPIDLFNNGEMERDFTYVDDIVSGICGALKSERLDNRIYNLGNNKPVKLREFVETLESVTGKSAIVNLKPMQQGDVVRTYADISRAQDELGFEPSTDLRHGLVSFVEWFRNYYS